MCGSHVTAQCCVEWPVGISVATVCVSIDFHPRKLTRELTGGSFRAKMWKNPGRWKSSPRKKGETSAVNSHSVVATGNVRLPLAKGREKKEVNMSLKWNTVNSKTARCIVQRFAPQSSSSFHKQRTFWSDMCTGQCSIFAIYTILSEFMSLSKEKLYFILTHDSFLLFVPTLPLENAVWLFLIVTID